MDYEGTIIAESLADKNVLRDVRIVTTRVERVTPAHHTPWLKQWTLHTITVPANEAARLADRLSQALELSKRPGGNWYIDYKNQTTHYIIFPQKVFKITRAHPEQYRLAVDYDLSLSIPTHQLDFSPAIKAWEREK